MISLKKGTLSSRSIHHQLLLLALKFMKILLVLFYQQSFLWREENILPQSLNEVLTIHFVGKASCGTGRRHVNENIVREEVSFLCAGAMS